MARKYQTALVTGASSGMGKDAAFRLLKEGMTVYAVARSVDKMKDLEEAGAITLKMDITNDAEVLAVVERLKADGGLDVLLNNAGYGQYGSVEETPIDDARYQFDVNIFGLARLTQLIIPMMREKGAGLIINVSSMGGVVYTPLGAWYHATKHALEGWSDCLRFELEPFGIDVVVIQPGIINTGFADVFGQKFVKPDNSPYAKLIASIERGTEQAYKAGRFSEPSVISDAIIEAVRAKKPKTRYARGALGPMLMRIRRLVSDRMFDRVLRSQI